ncbi:MAG: phosphoribosylformylglycinamidine synthase subunit PurS, partial [Chloroflexi bacterium]|nr:phosphoribosylformylglycinamidine synthase subunit PurS [Chloroflexota bacterium]
MHRVEVNLKSHLPDARGLGLVKDIRDLGIATITKVGVVDVYWLDADLPPAELDLVCRGLLADPVTQQYHCESVFSVAAEAGADYHTVEVTYNAGVTDPVEATIGKAIRDLGFSGVRAVKTAKRFLLQGRLSKNKLEVVCNRLLVNPIIQHVVR